jgi:hypothetical protein
MFMASNVESDVLFVINLPKIYQPFESFHDLQLYLLMYDLQGFVLNHLPILYEAFTHLRPLLFLSLLETYMYLSYAIMDVKHEVVIIVVLLHPKI